MENLSHTKLLNVFKSCLFPDQWFIVKTIFFAQECTLNGLQREAQALKKAY